MLKQMIKTLVLISISLSVAFALLQAFVASKMAH